MKTVAEAANVLLNDWKVKPGAKHLATRRACSEVLQGLKTAHVARKAFQAGSAQAKILDTEHQDIVARMTASLRRSS